MITSRTENNNELGSTDLAHRRFGVDPLLRFDVRDDGSLKRIGAATGAEHEGRKKRRSIASG
jgi:hypothetical protein